MEWLLVALISYFLSALVVVLEKFLLEKHIPNSVVFTFFTGLLSIFVLPLAFFFKLDWPGILPFLADIFVGALFLASLYAFFEALSRGEASRVTTLVGAMNPVFIFIFSYIFLGERLGPNQLVAFFFLVLGGFLIAAKKIDSLGGRSLEVFGFSVLAALLMGIYYTLIKAVLASQDFMSGFIWTRLGSFLGAFLFLVPASTRKILLAPKSSVKPKGQILFVLNKGLGGLSFILLNFAIFLGTATLVNAVGAVQYVFILILTIVFSLKFPKILKEEINWPIVLQKCFSVVLIGIGLVFLTLK